MNDARWTPSLGDEVWLKLPRHRSAAGVSALQRMEPGDPRYAKAIEVMARGMYEQVVATTPSAAPWGDAFESLRDGYRRYARAALAALEAEGWVLTDTREVERLREAIRAELTHGGIRDRIAQATTIIGASLLSSPDMARAAAERLDRDRDAFYERMAEALSSVPGQEPA